ncbi:MAG: sugar phosphate isomerase/epimerase family protein [Armatimonadota bacterium]
MTESSPLMKQLVSSPCCLPHWSYDSLLTAYADLGFTKIEAFSEWAQGRLDWQEPPEVALQKAQAHGIVITSFHLPLIREEDTEAGLENAIHAARYAQAVGAKVVLFKAATRAIFAQVGQRFLDALDRERIEVTPALQNHKGSAISTLENFQEVFDSLGNDPRLKAVLEVGHFQRVGVPWQSGWELLSDRIALIHINEIRDGKSVLFGTGEVDFAGLLRKIKTTGYSGDIVVELELDTRGTEPQATLTGLRDAITLLTRLYTEA